MITDQMLADFEKATLTDIRATDPRIDRFIQEILAVVDRTPTQAIMYGFALLLGSVFCDATLASQQAVLEIDDRLKIFEIIVRKSYAETMAHAIRAEHYGRTQ